MALAEALLVMRRQPSGTSLSLHAFMSLFALPPSILSIFTSRVSRGFKPLDCDAGRDGLGPSSPSHLARYLHHYNTAADYVIQDGRT